MAIAVLGALARLAGAAGKELSIARDETHAKVSGDLGGELAQMLDRSARLLLIASPRSARSKWVANEIAYWRDGHEPLGDSLRILKVDGSIAWGGEDFDWASTDALPDALEGAFRTEPLWTELRARGSDARSERRLMHDIGVRQVAADLLDVGTETLDLAWKLQRLKRWVGVAVALAVVIGLSVWVGLERRAGELRAKESSSRGAAVEALELLSRAPGESLERALEGVAFASTQEAEFALRSAWAEPAPEWTRAEVMGFALDSASGLVLAIGREGRGEVVGLTDGARVLELAGEVPVTHGALASSADGRWLFTAAADAQTHVWNRETGELVAELPALETGPRKVVVDSWLRVRPSAGLLRVMHLNGQGMTDVPLRGVGDDFGPSWVAEVHDTFVLDTDVTTDGARVVSVGEDDVVCVWVVATRQNVARMRGHVGRVRHASFDAEGERVVSGGFDGTVRVWEVSTGAQRAVLRAGKGLVTEAAFGAAGRWLATLSEGLLRLWRIESGDALDAGHSIESGAWDPSGRFLAVGGRSGVTVYDAASEQKIAKIGRSHRSLHEHSFAPDGGNLVLAYKGLASVWTVAEKPKPRVHDSEQAIVEFAAFVSDGSVLAVAGSEVRVWPADGGEPASFTAGGSLDCAIASPDASRIVASGQGAVTVWDRVGGEARSLEGACDCGRRPFSPDGSLLLVRRGSALAVVSHESAEPVHELPMSAAVALATFSRDGARIGALDSRGTVRIWDAESGSLVASLTDVDSRIKDFDLEPTGTLVLTAGESGAGTREGVHRGLVWHVPTRTVLQELHGPANFFRAARFAPDGTATVVTTGAAWVHRTGSCAPLERLMAEGAGRVERWSE
ncbi:MAG: WD40 repeat domain-containing protein [bacterium]|nr:WD40 repeat domain-containing protein [bacterium]